MTSYQQYRNILQKAADFNNAAALLSWDQETYMPPKSASFRAQQLGTLASTAHEITTSESFGKLLIELKDDPTLSDTQKANVQRSLEDFDKNSKLSSEFVAALTQAAADAFNAWAEARAKNDFSLFAPALEKMVALKREQANLYGYENHPYDALLDEYEKGATIALLDPVFEQVKAMLPPVLAAIKAAQQQDDSFFYKHYPRQQQWDFSMQVLRDMGYDLEAGRQDFAPHPFSISFAPTDVRITTRVSEEDYTSLLWSTIHEGGHALYEQGLSEDEYGLPLGAACSLSIHESQSRLWENCVGRSLPFWQHYFPQLQQQFPQQLEGITAEAFYNGVNKVQPSFIRTEADELTYHFHVLIRYEIEKKLIAGTVEVSELPALWANMYEQYLGIRPKDFASGVLQDVHWSHGSFGYFPTYSLGSFYAAQFFEQARKDIPDLASAIGNGKFNALLEWLRDKVHRYGRRYTSEELCTQITGHGLDLGAFLRYVKEKYGAIYRIDL